jgi:NAD-dependent SIR2 family protein deacetylase
MVYIQDNKTHEAIVELLPTNKKIECPKCHRILRTKHFIFNEILKLEICTQCNKRVGTNKFYTPLNERKELIQ